MDVPAKATCTNIGRLYFYMAPITSRLCSQILKAESEGHISAFNAHWTVEICNAILAGIDKVMEYMTESGYTWNNAEMHSIALQFAEYGKVVRLMTDIIEKDWEIREAELAEVKRTFLSFNSPLDEMD